MLAILALVVSDLRISVLNVQTTRFSLWDTPWCSIGHCVVWKITKCKGKMEHCAKIKIQILPTLSNVIPHDCDIVVPVRTRLFMIETQSVSFEKRGKLILILTDDFDEKSACCSKIRCDVHHLPCSDSNWKLDISSRAKNLKLIFYLLNL